MQGKPLDVLMAALTAFAGVWIATAGVLGYFFRPMPGFTRFACLAAGIALMIPGQAFAGAIYAEIAGVVVSLAVLSSEYLTIRRLKTA